ncbi:hypothetical protein COT64_01595 [Candidatus Shapirobacteria bacterium CG09_land_8_20_14_0_10_39_12]|uniref:Uncharacterized protein n=1 Tax=Candidatus Shapirobacteria bacterium CG09_land_8_20_14_0_10_39_12 TaxID=1974885 RepID=A0A2H0WPQ2_9BACT|nr:MAG: hypothetical protein COT64_01595 [Candidatus Shapirobacteria bacterium CG09_land_8_20_14_0_10_39_12]
MLIEPIFIYILLVTIFFLSAVLIIVVWTQISAFKKFSEIKRETEQLRGSLIEKEADVLCSARRKGKQIIVSALKKATAIEADARVNQKQFKKLLNEELNRVMHRYSLRLEENSQKAFVFYQKSLEENMDKNIKILNDNAEDFKKALLSSLEKEIKEQKEEKLKRLSEEIFKVLQEASGEVLNRSLSLSNHEDLVLEALEKAQKSHGL